MIPEGIHSKSRTSPLSIVASPANIERDRERGGERERECTWFWLHIQSIPKKITGNDDKVYVFSLKIWQFQTNSDDRQKNHATRVKHGWTIWVCPKQGRHKPQPFSWEIVMITEPYCLIDPTCLDTYYLFHNLSTVVTPILDKRTKNSDNSILSRTFHLLHCVVNVCLPGSSIHNRQETSDDTINQQRNQQRNAWPTAAASSMRAKTWGGSSQEMVDALVDCTVFLCVCVL